MPDKRDYNENSRKICRIALLILQNLNELISFKLSALHLCGEKSAKFDCSEPLFEHCCTVYSFFNLY